MIYIFTNWDYANQINDLIKEYLTYHDLLDVTYT